jgi:hypothetical protein
MYKTKEETKKNFYLLQRTGLLIIHQDSMPNISTMLFLHIPEDLHELMVIVK